jgi:hypothetical protein
MMCRYVLERGREGGRRGRGEGEEGRREGGDGGGEKRREKT